MRKMSYHPIECEVVFGDCFPAIIPEVYSSQPNHAPPDYLETELLLDILSEELGSNLDGSLMFDISHDSTSCAFDSLNVQKLFTGYSNLENLYVHLYGCRCVLAVRIFYCFNVISI